MTEKTHHVSEKKKEIANNIQKLILEYPIIAAVDMENLPTPQLQQMRAQLRGKIELAMTKRRIIKHAIGGIRDKKKNIEQLAPYLKGMPALIFTKENPFSLFKTLKKSKTSAPAKEGQTAPFDIKIPKGPTSFAPGPIIGELAQLRIKAGVEGGKVVIKEDAIIVKKGQKISAKTAEILTRLGIKPMEVGLNITAVYENGNIFTKDILNIDEEKFMVDLKKAATWAFNLAVDRAYPSKETINVLIGKAFNDAKSLGLSQRIIDEGIIEELLSKAEISALSIKSTANIETIEKHKEKVKVKKEELKVEEQKIKDFPTSKSKDFEEKPTIIEKKEEEILEEEKEIIKEEEKIEKEVKKPKIEAPLEKEVEEEIKEEEEEKLEQERIEKEKELEKIEQQKKAEEEKRKAEEEERKKVEEEIKEEPQDEIDKKIAEMVAKTRKFVRGEIPSAEKLVEEASKLAAKELKKEEHKQEKRYEEKKVKEKVPTIQELKELSEKKKKEQEKVESLAQELIRKGTLRK